MAKKKSWFSVLKRLIILGRESRLEKGKRKRSTGKLKMKWLPLFSAPQPQKNDEHEECREEKQYCNYATATNNNNSAVSVPSSSAQSVHQCKQEISEQSAELRNLHTHMNQQYCYQYSSYDLEILNLASIKIQTAFRGYLARKALRALKGLVRLQAIIRGRAVRQQTIATLKRLQSIVNIQTQVCAQRCNLVNHNTTHFQENQSYDLKERDIKIDLNSQIRWDGRILSKEEASAMFLSKREAAIKRERIKEYWLSHRRSAESEHGKPRSKHRYWLEQWVDAQLAKRQDLETLDTVFSASARMKLKESPTITNPNFLKQQQKTESLVSPKPHIPRRLSQHRRQNSIGDESSSSPVVLFPSAAFPTYMAATESAKAKTRSLSSPRLRPMKFDAYSETNSPCKYKLSPISSINSEVTVTLNPSLSQRSLCLKSVAGHVRSSRSLKNISLEKDFLN